jgi:2-keto-4-pentenoate hydratase/2-oxohepta-3-ene-1,7-dioic acid hydratase in catechol pathway
VVWLTRNAAACASVPEAYDLQAVAKKMGRPWEVGKAFEKAAPCSPIQPAERIGHPTKGAIWLDLDGERRQTGDLSQMIWDIPSQIEYLSGLWELKAGDLIFTGTPAGHRCGQEGRHARRPCRWRRRSRSESGLSANAVTTYALHALPTTMSLALAERIVEGAGSRLGRRLRGAA